MKSTRINAAFEVNFSVFMIMKATENINSAWPVVNPERIRQEQMLKPIMNGFKRKLQIKTKLVFVLITFKLTKKCYISSTITKSLLGSRMKCHYSVFSSETSEIQLVTLTALDIIKLLIKLYLPLLSYINSFLLSLKKKRGFLFQYYKSVFLTLDYAYEISFVLLRYLPQTTKTVTT